MEEASGSEFGLVLPAMAVSPRSPIVSGGWKYNAAAKKIEIDLEQSQTGAAYRLPIEVAVSLPGAPPGIQRIECTAKSQKFELAADKEPSSVELDPNVWVLMESKFTRK